ncbi:MAG: hypothetical protein AB1486_14630 [Planctomycetota bacterium]
MVRRGWDRVTALAASAILALTFLGVATAQTVFWSLSPESHGHGPVAVLTAVMLLPELDWLELLGTREFWFVPAGIVALAGFLFAQSRRMRLACVLVSLLLPLIFGFPTWNPLPFVIWCPVAVPVMAGWLVGTPDAETWWDGYFTYCAMGLWGLLWVVEGVALLVHLKKRDS